MDGTITNNSEDLIYWLIRSTNIEHLLFARLILSTGNKVVDMVESLP